LPANPVKGILEMSANNHNVAGPTVVRVLRAAFLWLALALAAPSFAADSGDIFVTSLRGDVQITVNGTVRAIRAGGVLELPASVRTGHDGSIELRQGATTLSVGPDSLLNFPALERRGAPIDVIQQPRGNAFYDIGKRTGRKLRVETPYLVGVVKGTQFNVAVQDDATTISLFEGRLEVRASDDSDVVELMAGEIAARKRGDNSINVIRMDAGRTTGAARGENDGGDDSASGGGETLVAPRGPRGVSLVDTSTPGRAVGAVVSTSGEVAGAGNASASVSTEERAPGAAVGADVAVASGGEASADPSTNASVAGAAEVNAGVNVGVNVSVSVNVNANAGASGAAVDTSTSVTVSAGPVTVDAGPVATQVDTATSVDAGTGGVSVDVGTSTAVDAGQVGAAVDTETAVDISAGGASADLGAATSVDTGPISTAVDTATSVDLGTSGSTSVDTGVALGVVDTPVEVDAGVSAGVDVSTGTVDLGLTVAGADLGLGVDLGLGGSEPATDTDSSTTDTATDTGNTGTTDVGGLLDGLVRRPGRQ
jgi:hypothetical protein